MPVVDFANWSDRLEALARPALPDAPLGPRHPVEAKHEYATRFLDECGDRRATDLYLISHLLGLDGPPNPPRTGASPDEHAWHAVQAPDAPLGALELRGDGALAPSERSRGIEAWTEIELSSLHALATIATMRNDPSLKDRCRRAVEWHLAELQPDNGTNHPWAVHAFVWASSTIPHAKQHAGTLVHNACVQRGRPEALSALILLHSAKMLRALSHASDEAVNPADPR